jgi:hypothetical protein
MPDTPPVVTVSFCDSNAVFPFVTATAVPFGVAPFVNRAGRLRSEVCSTDMGYEREEGEMKTLACAAVVGRDNDSMFKGTRM